MTTAILVCGSLAFDSILGFEGAFADHILPQSLSRLSVSFFAPHMRKEFGGCAGNIAYNIRQLGGQVTVAAALGTDGASYLERLRALSIDTDLLHHANDAVTAQAMILSDSAGNQITAFHPGAMTQADRIGLDKASLSSVALAIVGPDGKAAMQRHVRELAQLRIPFVFDPGQGLPMFDGAELAEMMAQASWVTVNEYEADMLCDKTGSDRAGLAAGERALLVTLAERGCEVWQHGKCSHVAPVQATQVLDPTGCGDAFRAALLLGLQRGLPLVRCCEIGNAVGAIKIAHQGGQNHKLDAAALGL